MTGRGPRYHQHTPEWNKHMVKRVLENARYTGTDGYPPLVSGADFAAARLEISGPAAAEDLLAEPILSWEIAALEVAS